MKINVGIAVVGAFFGLIALGICLFLLPWYIALAYGAFTFLLYFVILSIIFYRSEKKRIGNAAIMAKEKESIRLIELRSLLKCEVETFENAENLSVIMEKYENLLAQGKKEGFTPLIVNPSETLLEMMGFATQEYKDGDYVRPILEKTRTIDAEALIKERIQEATPIDGDSGYDILGEFTDYDPIEFFHSLIDYATGRPYQALLIAKIPTQNPWEVAAWIPMGGWNECPAPEDQIAVFKRWYEKYGAIPAVVHGDIWELYAEKSPSTKEEAAALAWEHFGFCGDIIWQGAEKINLLASSLLNSKVWYFWWD